MSGFGGGPFGGAPWGGSEDDSPGPDEALRPDPYSVAGRRSGSVKLKSFSGEPRSGLLSGARGLVFFSPALLDPSSTGSLDLESISVSSRGGDRYTRPPERNHRLFRFGGGPGCVAPDWPSLTNSALYQTQPKEYSVVATMVQTTPPGPTTVVKIA